MKKSYLLVGMFTFGAVANISAMEKDRSALWRQIDQCLNKGDWNCIIDIPKKHGETGDLVNEYRAPIEHNRMTILECAIEQKQHARAYFLLNNFNINQNLENALYIATVHKNMLEGLVNELNERIKK
jgi:hypothetical protein